MWRSLRPTSTRPSARHRSCRSNQPSVRRRRRIQEEEKRDENRNDISPGLLIPPSFPWDTFLLQILQTLHSVTIDGRNVQDVAVVGASCPLCEIAPLWIIELVEEEETCAGFVVTAEPVINARTTASWELESYLTWSRGFIYPKRMETSGRTRTLSNSVVRDRHYCSGLISTFSNKMILKHRQFIMLMLQIFHQQCWVFYVCSRFQLLGCVIRRVYNV